MLTCNYELIEIAALQYIFEGIGYYFNEEIYEQKCYCQYPVVLHLCMDCQVQSAICMRTMNAICIHRTSKSMKVYMLGPASSFLSVHFLCLPVFPDYPISSSSLCCQALLCALCRAPCRWPSGFFFYI